MPRDGPPRSRAPPGSAVSRPPSHSCPRQEYLNDRCDCVRSKIVHRPNTGQQPLSRTTSLVHPGPAQVSAQHPAGEEPLALLSNQWLRWSRVDEGSPGSPGQVGSAAAPAPSGESTPESGRAHSSHARRILVLNPPGAVRAPGRAQTQPRRLLFHQVPLTVNRCSRHGRSPRGPDDSNESVRAQA